MILLRGSSLKDPTFPSVGDLGLMTVLGWDLEERPWTLLCWIRQGLCHLSYRSDGSFLGFLAALILETPSLTVHRQIFLQFKPLLWSSCLLCLLCPSCLWTLSSAASAFLYPHWYQPISRAESAILTFLSMVSWGI